MRTGNRRGGFFFVSLLLTLGFSKSFLRVYGDVSSTEANSNKSGTKNRRASKAPDGHSSCYVYTSHKSEIQTNQISPNPLRARCRLLDSLASSPQPQLLWKQPHSFGTAPWVRENFPRAELRKYLQAFLVATLALGITLLPLQTGVLSRHANSWVNFWALLSLLSGVLAPPFYIVAGPA